MKFGITNPLAVKPKSIPVKDMGTGNPPFVDKTKPLPVSMPYPKSVASARRPIGAPLSNQNTGFFGQAPQKIISAVKNSAPAQNVGSEIGQHLSNDFFKQAGPLIGNALGNAFNQSRPSTGGTLEQMPQVTTTSNNAPMPSNVNTGFFKKGGKVQSYTTKDGKLNLSACGVSTASKNKSSPNW